MAVPAKSDPWMAHLIEHRLRELHDAAQKVRYRVRTADWQTFSIEYEGGLPKYREQGMALKYFAENEAGKAQARAFLAQVQADIDELKSKS